MDKKLKKCFLSGMILSFVILVINNFYRKSSFPEVEFSRALIYYIPFLIIGGVIFLFLGWIYNKLVGKNYDKKIVYPLIIILTLLSVSFLVFITYIMNFTISFLGSF